MPVKTELPTDVIAVTRIQRVDRARKYHSLNDTQSFFHYARSFNSFFCEKTLIVTLINNGCIKIKVAGIDDRKIVKCKKEIGGNSYRFSVSSYIEPGVYKIDTEESNEDFLICYKETTYEPKS